MKRGHAAAFAREQLEQRVKNWRRPNGKPPPQGWIRAIREALGMSARQLGQKLKISQPAVTALERAEARGTIRLSTLQKAAKAMGCQVYYLLAPANQKSFADIMKSRAFSVSIMESTMSLGKSGIKPDRYMLSEYIKFRAESIPPHLLWEDEELDRQYGALKKLVAESAKKKKKPVGVVAEEDGVCEGE